MRMHKDPAVCFKVCSAEPMFYENQFGEYCMLSHPNQRVSKEFVFREINFWEYIKFKIRYLFVKMGGTK